MEKEKYESPVIEVIRFETEDVIVTSNCSVGGTVVDSEGNG